MTAVLTVDTLSVEVSKTPPKPPPIRGFKPGFRRDIEGLRAVAVVTVLAFHAHVPGTTGGFVGVDVFFVISGFLITGLLLDETATTGRLDFLAFYARRARRILPSAAVVIIATGIGAWFLLPMLKVFDTAKDMLASALYVANWRFIDQGTNYLAPSNDHSPFLHYWSLAVEEQFYLFWPFAVWGLMKLARRLYVAPQLIVIPGMALVAAGSFALALWQTPVDPVTAYLGTPARAWQFAIGAILAASAPWLHAATKNAALRSFGVCMGWAGGAAIVFTTVWLNEDIPYPGTAAVLPTLGAAGIILSGMTWGASKPGGIGETLSMSTFRAVGRLSFTWYLWHWPVLVLGEAVLGPSGWVTQVALVLGSALPAMLTMWLIERPIRFSRFITARTTSGLAIGLTATLLASLTGLGAGSAAVQSMGGVAAAASVPLLAQVFDDAADGTSGDVSPSPLAARDDRPKPDECLLQDGQGVSPQCRFGDINDPTVVLFGDSHAQQWSPAFEALAEKYSWSLVVLTKAGCPAAALIPRQRALYSQPDCVSWRKDSVRRITEDLNPSLIVVSSLHWYIPNEGEVLAAWNNTLDQLRVTGVPIFYIEDTPNPGKDIAACMSSALDDWSNCSFPRDGGMKRDGVVVEALAGNEDHIEVGTFTNYLCPEEQCPAARSGVLFYRDDSHISATLARILSPAVDEALKAAGLISPAGEILGQ